MVALSTAFYARLSIGSRQIVEIFNILNEFMDNIFVKYQLIRQLAIGHKS